MNIQHIEDLIKTIASQLKSIYPSPEQCIENAWHILQAITNKNHAQLLAADTTMLNQEQNAQLNNWLDAMVNRHMPLQYLLGSVPFNDLTILVQPPVLIPRQETEEWCSNLIEQLAPLHNKSLIILDLCTGSGCIALALASALPQSIVYGIDNALHALNLAKINALHNKINNVIFLYSNLFAELPSDIRFDIIVSNPPYIAADEWNSIEKSVTEWEDKHALIAQHNGLDIITKIIHQAPLWLNSHSIITQHRIPQLFIEIGHKQATDVTRSMQEANFIDIHIIKDLAHNDRCVSGRVSYVATHNTSP